MITSEHDVPAILSLDGVEAVYEGIIIALCGVSLVVPEGSIVALLGANGAGKTTTLKASSGLLRAEGGTITKGAVTFRDAPMDGLSPRSLVPAGLVQVLEGRRCFPHLTVEENLVTGTLARHVTRAERRRNLEMIYDYFPRLTKIRRILAGLISGGEQQMVALGRALMAQPTLVLLDEPSMGLAPQIVEEIFEIIRGLNHRDGVSFLLAEQNARIALRFADHGYILENGRVVAGGTSEELARRSDVQEFYLGVGSAGSRNHRDMRRPPSGPERARHP